MLTPLIAFGVFITVILLFEGGYYLVRSMSRSDRDQNRVKERLQSWTERPDSNQHSEIVKKDTKNSLPWLDKVLVKLKEREYTLPLVKMHDQAKAKHSLSVYLVSALLLACLGGFLGRVPIYGQPFVTLGSAGIGMVLPWGYLYLQKRRRLGEIHRQLPEALELMARALRAGHALFVGMKMVGEEMREPIGGEFRRSFDEISMGVSVPESLMHLRGRVDLMDVKFFVTSVNVQRETGGNLAEIIDSLGRLIRKRFELKKKIKALSAEGRISAIILIGLPFGIALVLQIMNPDYLVPLFTDPIGHVMVAGAAIMMIIGGIVMKQLISIKV
jgi:tight adherence protein B